MKLPKKDKSTSSVVIEIVNIIFFFKFRSYSIIHFALKCDFSASIKDRQQKFLVMNPQLGRWSVGQALRIKSIYLFL